MAWRKADRTDKNALDIEYAAPHICNYGHLTYGYGLPRSTVKATQTIRVRKDEWEYAYVFSVDSDRYRPSEKRHQEHLMQFIDSDQCCQALVCPYRVVVTVDSSFDYVRAVPEIDSYDECADEFIRYLTNLLQQKSM